MSIQDISKILGFWSLGIVLCFSQESTESLKFNTPVLDTALNVMAAKRINTAGLEFSPTYYKNGIVYVSVKDADKRALQNGEVFISLKYAPLNEKGLPIAPVPFAIDEKTQNHKGPVTFTENENAMLLSRSNMVNDQSEEATTMNIYKLIRGDTFWVDQQNMPFNMEGYTSFHPTVSDDGNFIVFSSNRPGGYGRYDLYAAEKVDGNWSEAFNLGPAVNSRRNEAFPYLYEGKYLFFSSDRRGGKGQEDFYWTKKEGTKWTKSKNLGTPFNSNGAEVGIIFDENGTQGFFSSNRDKGEGGDDIYAFFSSVHLFEDRVSQEPRSIMVNAVNESNKMRLANTSIWLFPVDNKGMILDRSAYQTHIVEDQETKGLTLEVERKKAGELGAPDYVTDRNGQTTILLSPNTIYRLVGYKPGFREVDTLISYHMDQDIITFAMDEVSCLPLEIEAIGPESKKLTNFKVKVNNLGEEQLTSYDFPSTEEVCVAYNKAVYIIGYKEDYIPDTVQIAAQSKNVKKMSVLFRLIPEVDSERAVSMENVDERKEEIEKGATIVLNNIYYDYNKSSIRVGAEEDLDALANIMKQYPGMEIELSAHTDSRGGELYNLRLSLRRAESAKEYLVNKGIDSDRIQAIGYGESRIRNKCEDGVDCTEKLHQFNRRTEIKIVEMEEDLDIQHDNSIPNK